jgi:Cu(I)/Ag(I) efflux system membrane fusion protein
VNRLAFALAMVAVVASCRSAKHDAPGVAPAPIASIAADPHAGHVHTADSTAASAAPPGYAPITVDPARADAMGLATAPVEEAELTKTLRTLGVVALDETRSAHVHAKVRGWIDGVSVDFVGRRVHAGEPLCSIYSQDVYAAEVEFLSILDRTSSSAAASGEFADAEKRAQVQLLAAARRRLSLWDVPKGEIERLETTREPRRTFPLLAPREGVVVAKEAIEGMYVEPSLELYTLSDLSRVWILADIYETDVPYVHVGDHAMLSIEGLEAPTHAKVAFLAPTIDEATRTLKARFELPNTDNKLRPGAFVSAEMRLDLGEGLSIPESAVIRTGTRAIVFVAHGDPPQHLMPREVKLGPLVGDRYRVDEGLAAGDRVATGAQFLLDSESRLRATSGGGGHAHAH